MTNKIKNTIDFLDEKNLGLEKIFEEMEMISCEFSPKEINFIKASLRSFEDLYKTKPLVAIRCLLFPEDIEENENINKNAENFWNNRISEFLNYYFYAKFRKDDIDSLVLMFYEKVKNISENPSCENVLNHTQNLTKGIIEM